MTLFHKSESPTHWRCAGKDYGWYHEAPGIVIVNIWWPHGVPCDHSATPWAD